LLVERVLDRPFDWLVVGRQGTIDQAGRAKKPAAPVGLHDKRIGASQGIQANSVRVSRRVGGLGGREVRDVVPGPLLAVPPDPPLPLAPGLAVRASGGAVVHDPPVRRPGVGPAEVRGWAEALRGIGDAAGGAVLLWVRKDGTVDPGG